MISLSKFKRYISIAFIALIFSTFNFSNFNLNIGTPSYANSTNFDKLYWGSVVILRNAYSNKLLNIAEGPIGPNVIWSPETAKQNNDNTNVVLRKEGTNIIMLMNRHTRKVLGVNKSGLSESKLEVQTPTYNFNPYQSFYVDYLSNGNIYFTSVAFPTKIITLPYGGTRNDYVNYILYDNNYVADSPQSQFKVDYQGDGANTSFGETEVTYEAPAPQVTKPEATPIPEVKQQPTPQVTNQYDKLRTGAVIVLRNADLNQSVNVRNLTNGSVINGAPASTPVDDEMILVAVNKPGTNIYQFFNRKNGKVLSVSTKGEVGDWAEVWNRVPGFNPYQSFYIDTLANGNIVLCPVAFPNLVLNLPEGGRTNTYQHYTLWSKEDLLNGLNRQFRVDVLDYGADVSIRPEPVSNKSTSNSNIYLKNKGTLTTQSLDFGNAFRTILPNLGGPILGPEDLVKDKVIFDGWEDSGRSVVHRTYWGYYIYSDKIGTINTIRNLEQLNNYYNFGKELGALAIGKQLFESLMKRVFKVNPIITSIEAALIVQTTLFVPEAISQANYCLNTKEQSYLKVYYPGYLTVSCD